MYYPYFRGKQNELILLRDNAQFIAVNNIHPIVEPVKKNLTALKKAFKKLNENNVNSTLIINPQVGDLAKEKKTLSKKILKDVFEEFQPSSLGYILHAGSDLDELGLILNKFGDFNFSLIHYGFSDSKELIEELNKHDNIERHIFIDEFAGKLYKKQLKKDGIPRILIKDGFKKKKRNVDYPDSEHFSDLHITFSDEGMDGFGDFLIVGDDYNETGGPAYAVAIHLTYIDEDKYDDMFIFHFKADQSKSPTNPGGKFLEALYKLVRECKKQDSKIFKSKAINEYLSLYDRKHFPGLGYVKKLSMQHHLELIADYIKSTD